MAKPTGSGAEGETIEEASTAILSSLLRRLPEEGEGEDSAEMMDFKIL